MSHGLPDAPDEPDVNRSLDCLAPLFRVRVLAMLGQMRNDEGLDPIISESCRTDERQAWLFGFGREWDDGRGVVTHAATGNHGWHKFGLAVDVISQDDQWDAPASFWRALGVAARAQGLAWGGDWPKFKDLPHVQFGPPMRQAPSSRAAELWAQGREVLWREVGAL